MGIAFALMEIGPRLRGAQPPGGPGVPVRPDIMHNAAPMASHFYLFFVCAFLALTALAVIVLVFTLTRKPRVALGAGATSPVLSELDLRYARGEINREDYLQRRADLTGGPQPPTSPPA